MPRLIGRSAMEKIKEGGRHIVWERLNRSVAAEVISFLCFGSAEPVWQVRPELCDRVRLAIWWRIARPKRRRQ